MAAISAVDYRIPAGDSILREGGNSQYCCPQYAGVIWKRAMAAIGRINQKTFEQSIVHGVTLVDFYASWCGPCCSQNSIIDVLKKNCQRKVTVRKINIDENRDIAMHLGIQSIPTIILFKEGREMSRFFGLQTNDTLRKALKQLFD